MENAQKEHIRVLIIEDDQLLSEDLASMLTLHGFRSDRARTAQDAISKLRNQKFDCILLDLKLERSSGEEVLAAIRRSKEELNAATPVIITSGYLDAELIKRIGKHVTGILVKPFDGETLVSKVKVAIASPNARMTH